MTTKKIRHEGFGESISSLSKIRLRHDDYTVGWMCALPVEMSAAKAMLDEDHLGLQNHPSDDNSYTLGRMGEHNVVIVCLPAGGYGTTSAATVAAQMQSSFRRIRFGLMVGIGGGVPGGENDIRLGDVVVSEPGKGFGGVVQYDYGKVVNEGRFERTGTLDKPPQVLLTAVSTLRGNHNLGISRIQGFLDEMANKYPTKIADFASYGQENDRLFEAEYDHVGSEDTCGSCDASRVVGRSIRGNDPRVHYGLIASGNRVMKHGGTRDRLAQELGILCFEMEAAGLMDNFKCLVIRGICDYADSHKNKKWQGYAALTAAAYAKELLSVIQASEVKKMPPAARATSERDIGAIDDNVANTSEVGTDGDDGRDIITISSDDDNDSELAIVDITDDDDNDGELTIFDISSDDDAVEDDIDIEQATNNGRDIGWDDGRDIGWNDGGFEETGSEPSSDEDSWSKFQ